MSVKETIWEASHEIPYGAFIPEGTELVQYDTDDSSLTIYTSELDGPWMGSSKYAPVRSTEPLPDPNDTGNFRVEVTDNAVFVHSGTTGYYSLTKVQARNLARKITEAADGN